MSIERNKAMVRDLHSYLAAGSLDKVGALIHPDVRWWVQGKGALDKSGICENLGAIIAMTKSRTFDTRVLIGEGDMIHMVNRVEMAFRGGATLENLISLSIVIRDGMIADVHEFMDIDRVREFFSRHGKPSG